MNTATMKPSSVSFQLEHRGTSYPVYFAADIPPDYRLITDRVYTEKEKGILTSMWDRLKSEDCLLGDWSDKSGEGVAIYRHEAELDPWRTGGFTDDSDGLRVSIGIREGLRPHLVSRLKKYISCFHA